MLELRKHRPESRIMHEVHSGGTTRVDVMAVGVDEIVVVEIKGERDTISRLPIQIGIMRDISHICVAALHEKFLSQGFAVMDTADGVDSNGKPFGLYAPREATGAGVWIYPKKRRALNPKKYCPLEW